jgi:hypothetical protein
MCTISERSVGRFKDAPEPYDPTLANRPWASPFDPSLFLDLSCTRTASIATYDTETCGQASGVGSVVFCASRTLVVSTRCVTMCNCLFQRCEANTTLVPSHASC